MADRRDRDAAPFEEPPVIDELLKERAMDAAPVGITITDPSLPDNPLIYVNDSFEEMTGYVREDVLGRNCRFLQGPETDADAVATLRTAIEAAEPTAVELLNYRRDGTPFWNRVTIAPIRDGDGTVTHFVGFQMDVTARKETERALERERQNLEHLLDRVNGLVGDVTTALVGATSREEIERTVCDRFVETDPYTVAWVGTLDLTSDAVSPRTWAGTVPEPPELSLPREGDGPVARALESGDLQVASADALVGTPHEPVVPEGGALAAIPLAYRDARYGVLVIGSETGDAFDERETAVLSALGRALATAINAVEGRRLLTAETAVELRIRLADDALYPVAVTAESGVALTYTGSVYQSDGPLLEYVTASNATPEELVAALEAHPTTLSVRVLSDGPEETLLEVAVREDSLVPLLAEHGAATRTIEAADGRVGVTVDLPGQADARALVDRLRERYGDVEVRTIREHDRPAPTRQAFTDALTDALTDRQLTALKKAYLSGYFDPSRPVTGEELAASMGVSRATFHQHLRAAQRKTFERLFGEL